LDTSVGVATPTSYGGFQGQQFGRLCWDSRTVQGSNNSTGGASNHIYNIAKFPEKYQRQTEAVTFPGGRSGLWKTWGCVGNPLDQLDLLDEFSLA
jgi:hypothetical protein